MAPPAAYCESITVRRLEVSNKPRGASAVSSPTTTAAPPSNRQKSQPASFASSAVLVPGWGTAVSFVGRCHVTRTVEGPSTRAEVNTACNCSMSAWGIANESSDNGVGSSADVVRPNSSRALSDRCSVVESGVTRRATANDADNKAESCISCLAVISNIIAVVFVSASRRCVISLVTQT